MNQPAVAAVDRQIHFQWKHYSFLFTEGTGATCVCEAVWPSGEVLVRLVSSGTSVRIHFGSPFSSKVVVCGHCLVTVSLTIMKH